MKQNNFMTILFNGQRRVFFILFACALLAQIYLFARQSASYALDKIQKDFKIVLSYNAAQDKQDLLTKHLKNLPGIKQVKNLSSQDIFDIFSKGAKGQSDYVLNPAFLPAIYEVEVNRQVLLDSETWLHNNLYKFDDNLEVYYKTEQAKLAIYLKAFLKYTDIMAILVLLALISFGFFVEAYYTQISTAKERLAGLLCGLFAGAGAFIISKILLSYLVLSLPYAQSPFKEQMITLLLVIVLGGTMSKWKRF